MKFNYTCSSFSIVSAFKYELIFISALLLRCKRSSSSNNAKFFFKPQTPEDPTGVVCLSNGHWTEEHRWYKRNKQE